MIKEIFSANRSGAVINSELIALIEKSIQTALEEFDFEKGYQVSVSFVNEEEIQILNNQYRGIDRPTDVLSFPMQEKDGRGVATVSYTHLFIYHNGIKTITSYINIFTEVYYG